MRELGRERARPEAVILGLVFKWVQMHPGKRSRETRSARRSSRNSARRPSLAVAAARHASPRQAILSRLCPAPPPAPTASYAAVCTEPSAALVTPLQTTDLSVMAVLHAEHGSRRWTPAADDGQGRDALTSSIRCLASPNVFAPQSACLPPKGPWPLSFSASVFILLCTRTRTQHVRRLPFLHLLSLTPCSAGRRTSCAPQSSCHPWLRLYPPPSPTALTTTSRQSSRTTPLCLSSIQSPKMAPSTYRLATLPTRSLPPTFPLRVPCK